MENDVNNIKHKHLFTGMNLFSEGGMALDQKGKYVELLISGYSHDGKGVGRIEGKPVFVSGTLKDELVRVQLDKERKGITIGRLVEIIKPSNERVTPACPVFGTCGGCQLQHLNYQAQLLMKQQIVYDVLKRIGGLKNIEVQPVLGMAEPWGYRNKGHFRVENRDGGIKIGFFEEESHKQTDECCKYLFSRKVVDSLDRLPGML